MANLDRVRRQAPRFAPEQMAGAVGLVVKWGWHLACAVGDVGAVLDRA